MNYLNNSSSKLYFWVLVNKLNNIAYYNMSNSLNIYNQNGRWEAFSQYIDYVEFTISSIETGSVGFSELEPESFSKNDKLAGYFNNSVHIR